MGYKYDSTVIELYEDGFSTAQIGRLYEVSSTTVGRWLRKNGIEPRPSGWNGHQKGIHARHWKGGRSLTKEYIQVYVFEDDPMACMRTKSGYVLEHRLVMARAIGRPLTENETVHHKNGDTIDNVLSNLQLRSSAHGPGQVASCGECGSHNIVFEEIADE